MKKHVGAGQASLDTLEERLGYTFQERGLLQKAMIHRSYAFEQAGASDEDNETLEFLGDAVLDLCVGYGLIRHYPEMREGDLTRLRAVLVNERHLALMAREIRLGEHILLGKGEAASNGSDKSSILSCAYEAVVGALFMDGGYDAAQRFVDRFFVPHFEQGRDNMFLADAKSSLQERLQERFTEGPYYVLEGSEGPDHSKIFHVSVRFRDSILGKGSASSKKEAEQRAAAEALLNFDSLDLDAF